MRQHRRVVAAAKRAALPAVVLCAAALVSPAGAAATTVSSNWAGYVARSPSGRFSSVSASWTAPAVSCTAGRETHSAVWVGLGGYEVGARALEQIGTEADCTASGRALYSSWVELLPAAAQNLRLAVHPGDQLTASVTVHARHATLRLRDLTTGRRYSATRRLRAVDVSSAEWIVEAPSGCERSGCSTLALADFGSVAFSNATAISAGTVRTAAAWGPTDLLLRQAGGGASAAAHPGASVVSATPAGLSEGSFAITYGEGQGTAPQAPVLPGFSEAEGPAAP